MHVVPAHVGSAGLEPRRMAEIEPAPAVRAVEEHMHPYQVDYLYRALNDKEFDIASIDATLLARDAEFTVRYCLVHAGADALRIPPTGEKGICREPPRGHPDLLPQLRSLLYPK